MHPRVKPVLREFLGGHEGEVPFMYLDKATPRRVTTGIGCLLPNAAAANRWPWFEKTNMDGPAVTANRVEDEFTHVRRDMASIGLGPRESGWAFGSGTNLRIKADTLERMFTDKFQAFVAEIPGIPQLGGFHEEFPPDAQLAIMVHLWARGAGGIRTHRRLLAACFDRDWRLAARESGWQNAGPRRVAALRIMFNNAAVVSDATLRHSYRQAFDRTALIYPSEIGAMAPPDSRR